MVGFDKVDHPKADTRRRSSRGRGSSCSIERRGSRSVRASRLPAARMVAVGYGAGDQLLVATAAANGRLDARRSRRSTIDRQAREGRAATAGAAHRVHARRRSRSCKPSMPASTRRGRDPATAPSLKPRRARRSRCRNPAKAAQITVAARPGNASVAFATAVDACAKDAAPSLYVADAKTGALKHVLTAKSRFATRWIDPTTLAYDDGDGAIRLWDATTAREVQQARQQARASRSTCCLRARHRCASKRRPDRDAGSDEPLPAEEGSASSGDQAVKIYLVRHGEAVPEERRRQRSRSLVERSRPRIGARARPAVA